MRQKSQTSQTGAGKAIKDIRWATCKKYSVEEKIRIVLDGLRGEETIAKLCQREGIAQSFIINGQRNFLSLASIDLQVIRPVWFLRAR